MANPSFIKKNTKENPPEKTSRKREQVAGWDRSMDRRWRWRHTVHLDDDKGEKSTGVQTKEIWNTAGCPFQGDKSDQ